MEPSPTADLALELDAVFNFRDLGGFATKRGEIGRVGLLFRSDGLHRASPTERDEVAELGIGQVIDLRTVEERQSEGAFEHPGVEHRHVPVIEQLSDLATSTGVEADLLLRSHYRQMTTSNAGALSEALQEIATSLASGIPTVFHCTAGKDRTGVLAALVLGGLGVDDAVIADDYARSAAPVARMAEWYQAQGGPSPADRMKELGIDPTMVSAMLGADRSTMLGLLGDLRSRHGSVEAYLKSIEADEAVATIGQSLLLPVA